MEAEESAQKMIEDLIAIGLYGARISKVKEHLRTLLQGFERYLRPIEEVRRMLMRRRLEAEA